MRSIFIRHADKDFKNGNSDLFKHDPGITELGVERTKIIALKLVEECGLPTRIICSPFRRTRETAMVMNSVLDHPLADIEVDVGLSEYLGNHANVELDVTIGTQIHHPPHPESFDQMRGRVHQKLQKIRQEGRGKSKELVWFITHGIIIKQIAGAFGIKTSKQVPCLTCFSFVERGSMTRAEFLLFRDFDVTNIPVIKKRSVNKKSSEKSNSNSSEKNSVKRNAWKSPIINRIDRILIPPGHTGRDDMTGRVNK